MRPRRSRQSALAQPRSSSRRCSGSTNAAGDVVDSSRRASSAARAMRRCRRSGSRSSLDSTGSPSGLRTLAASRRQRVLVGRPHLRQRQSQTVGDPGEQLVGRLVVARRAVRLAAPRVGQQRVVGPQRPPVGAPVQRNLPARQRFSRIPPALAALDQPLRRPRRLQPGGQIGCPLALVRAVGGGRPLLVDLVVHRHERRLAADGEPDIPGGQPLVDVAGRPHRSSATPRRCRAA